MSRIGVVSALPIEARCLRGCRSSLGRVDARAAEITVGVSGPGPARAQCMAERLVEQGATELVSWGLAGGLDPGIAPGMLVIADQIVTATGIKYLADPGWRQKIVAVLPPRVSVVEAPLLASGAIVATSKDKATLRRRYAAVAVDMESGGIACVASRYELPFLALRVVVDPADMALPPAFTEVVDRRGALRLSRLVSGLARQPSMLWPLLQLAYNARVAASTLKRIAPVITDSAWRSPAPDGSLSTLP